ncbi:hypothetical protein AB0H83_40215 [Dactylosporangium sp. NPDC050688]|uniref:hypothetical protein n=1 Tax=Dactylosporangium sp. NPDC050688 TaxID=3157217 RepID=UPI0033CC59F7
MLAAAGGAVGLLAAATGLTPTLLFIVVIAVAALLVAWLAYLGKNPAKPLLTGLCADSPSQIRTTGLPRRCRRWCAA